MSPTTCRPGQRAADAAGRTEGLDLADLLAAVDDRLARLASDPDASPIEPPSLRRTTP